MTNEEQFEEWWSRQTVLKRYEASDLVAVVKCALNRGENPTRGRSMTDADKNRKVAEACGYTIAATSRKDIYEVWDDTVSPKVFHGTLAERGQGYALYDPLHDANQAWAAMMKTFGRFEVVRDGNRVGVRVWDLANGHKHPNNLLIHWADDFCAAAVNAILAAKGLA